MNKAHTKQEEYLLEFVANTLMLQKLQDMVFNEEFNMDDNVEVIVLRNQIFYLTERNAILMSLILQDDFYLKHILSFTKHHSIEFDIETNLYYSKPGGQGVEVIKKDIEDVMKYLFNKNSHKSRKSRRNLKIVK